jgi:hypothetical protein
MMFEYEEYWADWHLVIWRGNGAKGKWAYQIEAWSDDRYRVIAGRGDFDDSSVAIADGRNALFKNLIHSFNWEAKR